MTIFLALLSNNDKKNVVVFAHKKTTRSDLVKSFLVVYPTLWRLGESNP